jgi:hypothetical protein
METDRLHPVIGLLKTTQNIAHVCEGTRLDLEP